MSYDFDKFIDAIQEATFKETMLFASSVCAHLHTEGCELINSTLMANAIVDIAAKIADERDQAKEEANRIKELASN